MSKRGYRGHYCKICGEIKANEKFSGRGHRNHICKKCASLPIDKRIVLENHIIDFDKNDKVTTYEYDDFEGFYLLLDSKDEVNEIDEEEELPFT